MRTELKDVADAGDRNRVFFWPERSLLDPLRPVGDYDLVDLVRREARHLDRRFFKDQLLEFDLQLVEIPFAFFRKPVGGESEDALLFVVQMAHLNAGDAIEPVKLGRFKARLTV